MHCVITNFYLEHTAMVSFLLFVFVALGIYIYIYPENCETYSYLY